jgi:hypothetical protein
MDEWMRDGAGRAMRGAPAFPAGRGGEAACVRDGGFVHHMASIADSRKWRDVAATPKCGINAKALRAGGAMG